MYKKSQKELTLAKGHFRAPYRQLLNGQRGISLIPVIVSIAIFTALAVQYTLPQQQQRQNQKNLDAGQIAAAQLLQAALSYHVDNGAWPQTIPADVQDYFSVNVPTTNSWGNSWQFFNPPGNQGLILTTQAGSSWSANALAARFGGIARVCMNADNLCAVSQNDGTWVYIGIAPP
jgi:type II secretory pathway pseudopilin PulG